MDKKRNSNTCDVLNNLFDLWCKEEKCSELSFIEVFRAYHKNKSYISGAKKQCLDSLYCIQSCI